MSRRTPTVTLPPRLRRTHLGCRVLESARLQPPRRGAPAMLRLDITLFCPKPYIPTDIRPRSA